jgi:hypothetical protein
MNLRSNAESRRTISGRRIGALALTAIVLAASAVGGSVASAQAASNISTTPLNLLLGVGANETQRIASWYVPNGAAQSLEIQKTADLTGGSFTSGKKTIAASTAANGAADTTLTDSNTKSLPGAANQSGYYNAHATISSLEENTTYSYHVGAADGTSWSPTYTFSTKSFSGDFDFLFFGDPQIGSSGDTDLDGVGWAATLKTATKDNPNAELLVSGGDQVEHANNEYEWAAFSDSSDVLKQYAWASTIGNHDVGGKAYEQHNSLPNNLKNADYYPAGNTTTNSGGDYYYIYKDVLFIDINSNAYSGGSDAAHVNYVRGVVGKVGAKAKWTVLVYHHSIYSPADHANDVDNQQRRYDFTTAFSSLGIDMVLQGHDHSYSRSYSILNGEKANADEQPGAEEVFAGPGGVIYVTANSASGSKYYDLTTPDASKSGYGADPLDPTGERHWANSVENQEHVRTYMKISVSDDALDVSTIRAGDCTAPNAAVTRGNVKSCGVTLQPTATSDAAAVGSTVDEFSLLANVATTTTIAASTTSTVSDSTTPVVLTATVAGGLGTISGDVDFYEGSTLLGTSVVTSGKASLTLPASLSTGDHAYTAKFDSDSVFTGSASSSSAVTVKVTAPVVTPVPVVKAASTTALKYSKGKVTVTVAASGVTVAGTATIFEGSKILGTAKVAAGKGVVNVTLKKSGTHKLHAVFAATDTVEASTSKTVNVTFTKSTTTIKASKAKKATVKVTVKSTGHSVAGSVKIYDGSKLLKTVKVVKGKVTTKVNLKKGTHKLHAVFAATDTIAASTSKVFTVKTK